MLQGLFRRFVPRKPRQKHQTFFSAATTDERYLHLFNNRYPEQEKELFDFLKAVREFRRRPAADQEDETDLIEARSNAIAARIMHKDVKVLETIAADYLHYDNPGDPVMRSG